MTFARITTAGDASSAGATTLVSSSFTSVAGRLIVGYVGWEGGNTTISSISDTAGNTYVVGTPVAHGTLSDQCIASFYCLSSLGNASNVITTTLGASRSYRVIQAAEYSSAAAVTFDGTAYGESLSATTTTTAAIATTGAVGLLFAGAKSYNGTTFTAGGSLSLIAQQGTFGADEERFLTSSGSYAADIGHGVTSVSLVALAFKEGAAAPTVTSVTSSGVTEGGNMVFTVSLSGATSGSKSYAFGLTGTATAGTDYTSPLTSGMCSNGVTVSGSDFVVPDATSSWTITIPTTQDALDEDNETIVLTVGGTASTGGTITDDDAAPTISVTDASENAMEVVFTVSLSQASGKSITVDYATADGAKTAGTDYTAVTGTLTYAPGETTKTVTVAVL